MPTRCKKTVASSWHFISTYFHTFYTFGLLKLRVWMKLQTPQTSVT